jgi:hypothetical protein
VKRLLSILAAGLLGVGAAQAQEPAGAELLPPGPGRDATVRVCSACHELGVVSQKQLDPAGWFDIVQMMKDRGANVGDAETTEIVAYLAKAFPPAPPAPAAAPPPAAEPPKR